VAAAAAHTHDVGARGDRASAKTGIWLSKRRRNRSGATRSERQVTGGGRVEALKNISGDRRGAFSASRLLSFLDSRLHACSSHVAAARIFCSLILHSITTSTRTRKTSALTLSHLLTACLCCLGRLHSKPVLTWHIYQQLSIACFCCWQAGASFLYLSQTCTLLPMP
jgi:hypothetical protein